MTWVQSGPQVTAMASTWFLGWILACYGVGGTVAGHFLDRRSAPQYLLRKSLSICLGLFLLSVWTFGCAFLGQLNKKAILVFFAIGLVLCLIDKAKWGKAELAGYAAAWKAMTRTDKWLLFAFIFLSVVSFLAAQSPETGNDALSYHLVFARQHVEAGALVDDALHPRAFWPSMMGMLYAAGMAVHGVALAKLFSWISAPLLCLTAVSAAAAFSGASAARYTALLVVTLPILWMQSAYAYADNAIALYALAAFVCLWAWSRAGWSGGGAVPAALFLAALCSLKIYSVTHALVLGVLFLAFPSPGGFAKRIREAFGVALIVLVFCGFWYARSWQATGNPVYPFLEKLFQGNGFAQRMVGFSDAGKGPLDFILFPWNTALDPDLFGGEPLGALFLALMPLAIVAGRPGAFAAAAGFASLVFALFWFESIQIARFLLPVAAVGALFFGDRAAVMRDYVGKTARILIGVLAAVQIALSAYYPLKMLPAAIGQETAEEYLTAHERSYPFLSSLGSAVPEGESVLFVGESRLFYSPRRAVLMGPVIEKRAEKEKLDLSSWLRKENILYVVTASRHAGNASDTTDPLGYKLGPLSEPLLVGESLDPGDRFYYVLRKVA